MVSDLCCATVLVKLSNSSDVLPGNEQFNKVKNVQVPRMVGMKQVTQQKLNRYSADGTHTISTMYCSIFSSIYTCLTKWRASRISLTLATTLTCGNSSSCTCCRMINCSSFLLG